MKPEIELLEEYGLVRDQDSAAVRELSPKRFWRLYEQLYSGIYKRQAEKHWKKDVDSVDPFSFMASASLRADSTCGHSRCRLAKLDFLGRYTALYANQVVLPLWFSSPDEAAESPGIAMYELSQVAQSLLRLRALIEADLIVPVVMRSPHCQHTLKWAGRMIKAVRVAATRMARDSSSDFRVVYQLPEESPTGDSTLYITGPEDLLEHGSMVFTWRESPIWRLKGWRFDAEGRAEVRGAKKFDRLYDLVFEKIASDTTFYLAFGRYHSARYLSDRQGETFLLDALTEDEDLVASNERIRQYLTHLVPLLGDLPVPTLLR